MALIIDGYNLIYAANIVGRGVGPRALETARSALLNFVAASIDETELARTTVVFDATAAPPGLPRAVEHRGMTVRYASGYTSADELIEELIAADSAPKSLTVVSSDHRIQRAARRRRAQAIDSERWYGEMLAKRRAGTPHPEPGKPVAPPTPGEVEYWLKEFGGDGAESQQHEPGNPFPPGYGEDLEEDV
ncbi:MAG: hypothetical protein DWQ31_05610 [Planctomycetota bacterium]|nr:MAG: hypothetical protein DWQ31_05610 [Planctomycetota bacterium]REJ92989.1 MAG: hypothetical protein DWQ35_11160 [Planctomycetota bacterium]REK17348.1 MAG: hypothetical protein DWQ42_22450 [Planctomycetota bacterium]REK46023.1 MAG: hypothetical protein DWQ46_07620 [Planctomycetota bacterium]